MYNLPDDMISHIESFLQNPSAFKVVFRRLWETKDIFKLSLNKVNMLQKNNENRLMNKCVHCHRRSISCIVYENDYKIQYTPWCDIHIDKKILEDVDLYCMGMYIKNIYL